MGTCTGYARLVSVGNHITNGVFISPEKLLPPTLSQFWQSPRSYPPSSPALGSARTRSLTSLPSICYWSCRCVEIKASSDPPLVRLSANAPWSVLPSALRVASLSPLWPTSTLALAVSTSFWVAAIAVQSTTVIVRVAPPRSTAGL